MDQHNLNNLSFAKFKATFRVISDEPVELPLYTGSTFHGALESALRKVSYGRKPSCSNCLVSPSCRHVSLYAYLFQGMADHPFITNNYDLLKKCYLGDPALSSELNNVDRFPPPYILEGPEGGRYDIDECFILSFFLVGRAIEFFPFIVCGLEIMSAGWLGSNKKARFSLEIITPENVIYPEVPIPVYDSFVGNIYGPGLVFDFDMISRWVQRGYFAQKSPQHIGIRFLSPLKFIKDKQVSFDLDFKDFLTVLRRRIVFLSVHSPLVDACDIQKLLDAAEQIETSWSDYKAVKIPRAKNKDLYACIGESYFSGNLQPFLPYIKLGEFLHVGKYPTKGLGKYQIFFKDTD
jgi:hypothetical protein